MPSSIELLEAPPAWLAKGRARDQRNSAVRIKVIKCFGIAGLLVAAGLWSHLKAAAPADLSQYHGFQFGTNLLNVAKQTGADVSQATVIHRRPALMQELQWRPQSLGASSKTESAKDVVFSFYEGKLYRIVVDYDRYGTEGLTADDFVDAISAIYGPPAKSADPVNVASGSYGDRETILAQWQDSQNRFDLIRSSYGPTFKLVGVVKTLEVSAQAANLEARRLDDQEAPQRDAARLASDEAAMKAKLEAARLLNKPNFRP